MADAATASESKTSALVPLSINALIKAKDMTVDQIKAHFMQDTAEDLSHKQESAQLTEAGVTFMKTSRGLGEAINEILSKNEVLQKEWSEILIALGKGEEGSQAGFMRKLASSSIPLVSTWADRSIKRGIAANILEKLPDLLRQQWDITQTAADRIKAQITIITQSRQEAEVYFRQLSDDKIRLRDEATKKREEFDTSRKRLAEIEQLLKDSDKLDGLIAEGKPLPEGKKPLGKDEYASLLKERTDLIAVDNEREISLQTATQDLRAANDGYKMTEIQIGQMTTTLKAINAIGIMLQSFLKVTRPIMMREINIINAQTSGLRGAALFQALGQSMNETLKMCAYGMTVMTQQAVALGSKEFLESATVDEVKKVQGDNDATWLEFTKVQFDVVMKTVTPILEHKEISDKAAAVPAS